jgi:hypothetical protein
MSERKAQEMQTLRRMQTLRQAIQRTKENVEGLEMAIKNYVDENAPLNPDNYARAKWQTQELERRLKEQYDDRTGSNALKAAGIWFLSVIVAIIMVVRTKNLLIGIAIAGGAFILCAIVAGILDNKYEKQRNAAKKELQEEIDRRLKEAEAKDEKELKRIKNIKNQLSQQKRTELAPEIEAETAVLSSLEKEYREISILSEKDLKNDPKLISKLLYYMESYRADNLKEALLLVDEENRRHDRAVFAMEMEKLRQFEADQNRLRQAERDLEQTLHNARMERLAQKTLKEVEEARKDQEFYNRYGTTR